MTHGSQTIQQQGRLIQVRPQEGGGTSEHGEGKGWKVGKNQVKHPGEFKPRSQTCALAISKNRRVMSKRWKKYSGELIQEIRHYRNKLAIYQDSIASCIHCKADFQKRHGEANKYCSVECHDEFRVMKWLPCSVCMAAIGFGSQTSGRLLGITDSSIRIQWKKRGIVSNRPQSGSIAVEIRKQIAIKEFRTRKCNWEKIYAQSRMEDIRSHSQFPDWSIIAYRYMTSLRDKQNGSRYSRMTPEERAKHNSRWKNKCPIKRAIFLKRWKERRRIIDPTYPIIESFRSRLSMIAKGKTQRTKDLIGCTTAEFRIHLERNMKRGMTWENYGTYWHVDHIIPVASFDHTDPNQVAQCWHWTNLRPLEAKKNVAKGCRIIEPQMQLLLCAH